VVAEEIPRGTIRGRDFWAGDVARMFQQPFGKTCIE